MILWPSPFIASIQVIFTFNPMIFLFNLHCRDASCRYCNLYVRQKAQLNFVFLGYVLLVAVVMVILWKNNDNFIQRTLCRNLWNQMLCLTQGKLWTPNAFYNSKCVVGLHTFSSLTISKQASGSAAGTCSLVQEEILECWSLRISHLNQVYLCTYKVLQVDYEKHY